jgi:hypothetical protein
MENTGFDSNDNQPAHAYFNISQCLLHSLFSKMLKTHIYILTVFILYLHVSNDFL